MKDEPRKPLEALGDEALEARIVAWVLGEASAFEASEMEERCAENPDLKRFADRMREMHRLIEEDGKPATDDEWKLPEAKRQKVVDLLGVEPVIELPSKRRRVPARFLALGAAACLMGALMIWGMSASMGGSAKRMVAFHDVDLASPSAEKGRMAAELEASVDHGSRSYVVPESTNLAREEAFKRKSAEAPAGGARLSARSEVLAEELGTDATANFEANIDPFGESAPSDDGSAGDDPFGDSAPVDGAVGGGGGSGGHLAYGLDAKAAPSVAAAPKPALPKPMSAQPAQAAPVVSGGFEVETEALLAKNQSGAGVDHLSTAGSVVTESVRYKVDQSDGFQSEMEGAPEQVARLSDQVDKESKKVSGGESMDLGVAPQFGNAPVLGRLFRSGQSSSSWGATRPAEADASRVTGGLKRDLATLASDDSADEGELSKDLGYYSRFGVLADDEAMAESRRLAVGGERPSASGGSVPAIGDEISGSTSHFAWIADADRPQVDAFFADPAMGEDFGEDPRGRSEQLNFQGGGSVESSNLGELEAGRGGTIDGGDDVMARSLSFSGIVDFDGDAQPGSNVSALGGRVSEKLVSGIAGEVDSASDQVSPDIRVDFAQNDEWASKKPTGYTGVELRQGIQSQLELPASGMESLIRSGNEIGEVSLGDGETIDSNGVVFSGGTEQAENQSKRWREGDSRIHIAGQNWTETDEAIDRLSEIEAEKVTNLDAIRRGLYTADGAFNLGKYKEAEDAYGRVIREDPYNAAARRGLERVKASKADYYRAAYDDSRAELLAQVDHAWEMAIPPEKSASEGGDSFGSEAKARFDNENIHEFRYAGAKSGGSDGEKHSRGEAGETNIDSLAAAESRLKKLKQEVADPMASTGVWDFGQGPTAPAGRELMELAETQANASQEVPELLPEQKEERVEDLISAKDNSTTLDAMAEVLASDEAYSTFSMHVSDASFKLAAAAVERGEVPAAESVRPEEFYNAFDYGDPAPTASEPVACAVEQCAHPAFPQRNLLRIAVRTGAEGRAQSVPLNLTLLLDNSGSMEREDRAKGLNQAVAGLSSLLKEGDTVTVAGFSRQPRLLADRIDGKDGVTLNGLVDQTPAEGGTNLEEALKLGGDLAKRQFKDSAQNRVVLFTDGAANLGDADPESLNQKVEQLRNQGISFDAAGFGADGLNDRLLERLTRNGNGRYYVVNDENDADEGFAKQLAGAFRPAAENVKVQVVFNPSRVGNYKLIGFEEHRLKKEDFRNDAVDAAEMASEEAGVALYQFEILPEGQGEVGEVSVRFRDTSSGEMVEQSWPIPYDPQAPSFDEAKPGLQLAGIAAFVAEKLRGAPLSEAVDYSQLRGVMGRVKAEYSGNERVTQLERMMDR
ncbi:YfbK domain-containing protein [Haloferula sp.]|uniref:YfbK domain-containing protein n=1 Tax=Haloferula sp. TaxID=2497595 RepID=UPI00329F882A